MDIRDSLFNELTSDSGDVPALDSQGDTPAGSPKEGSLAAHDKVYHPEGYKEGNRCKFRDRLTHELEGDAVGLEDANAVPRQEEESQSSLVTPEEDAAYMEAVERGDMETAAKMIHGVAQNAGFSLEAFHGTELGYFNGGKPFTVFEEASHFGTKEVAEGVAKSKAEQTGGKTPYVYSVLLKIKKPKRVQDVPKNWDNTHSEYWWEQMHKAENEGYDGLVYSNGYEDKSEHDDSYMPLYPSQIKSADPVTYDDNGKVIPLSRRFDDGDDIRGDVTPRPDGEHSSQTTQHKQPPTQQDVQPDERLSRNALPPKWDEKTRADAERAADALRNILGGVTVEFSDKPYDASGDDSSRKSIIGVKGAKALGIGNLDEAEQMEREGKDRREIWEKTGWWKGKDGKWRVELPNPEFKPNMHMGLFERIVYNKMSVPLSEIIDSKELFKSYPMLKNVSVRAELMNSSGEKSYYDTDTNEIVLNKWAYSRDEKSVLGSLVHEIQHWIQLNEGLASGGSPEMFEGEDNPHEKYKALAGEVEARNAQKRLLMTPEERAATPPWETEDTPESEQITRFSNPDGTTVGVYNRKTGKITLYHGAQVSDVVHEFSHGLWQFAEQEAAEGRTSLQSKMHDIAESAPQSVKDAVSQNYPDVTDSVYLEECFTHELARKADTAFAKAIESDDGKAWYAKAWKAIKSIWKGLYAKVTGNKADLTQLDAMSPDEAANHILSEMAKGKNFGTLDLADGNYAADAGDTRQSIIGAKGAKNLGIKGLKDAKAMLSQGASRDSIYKKTGWWQGKDGKWRVEIPDLSIPKDIRKELKNELSSPNGVATGRLANFISEQIYPENTMTDEEADAAYEEAMRKGDSKRAHEILDLQFGNADPEETSEIIRAYPSLADTRVRLFRKKSEDGSWGAYDYYNNEITLYGVNPSNIKALESRLTHEVQHAIQKAEGLAKGGNMDDTGYDEHDNPTTFKNSRYWRSAGEVEARNAQSRFGTDKKKSPWKTEDVPADKQIVDMNKARAALANFDALMAKFDNKGDAPATDEAPEGDNSTMDIQATIARFDALLEKFGKSAPVVDEAPPEGSMQEHDRARHPNGFHEGDECKFRETVAEAESLPSAPKQEQAQKPARKTKMPKLQGLDDAAIFIANNSYRFDRRLYRVADAKKYLSDIYKNGDVAKLESLLELLPRYYLINSSRRYQNIDFSETIKQLEDRLAGLGSSKKSPMPVDEEKAKKAEENKKRLTEIAEQRKKADEENRKKLEAEKKANEAVLAAGNLPDLSPWVKTILGDDEKKIQDAQVQLARGKKAHINLTKEQRLDPIDLFGMDGRWIMALEPIKRASYIPADAYAYSMTGTRTRTMPFEGIGEDVWVGKDGVDFSAPRQRLKTGMSYKSGTPVTPVFVDILRRQNIDAQIGYYGIFIPTDADGKPLPKKPYRPHERTPQDQRYSEDEILAIATSNEKIENPQRFVDSVFSAPVSNDERVLNALAVGRLPYTKGMHEEVMEKVAKATAMLISRFPRLREPLKDTAACVCAFTSEDYAENFCCKTSLDAPIETYLLFTGQNISPMGDIDFERFRQYNEHPAGGDDFANNPFKPLKRDRFSYKQVPIATEYAKSEDEAQMLVLVHEIGHMKLNTEEGLAEWGEALRESEPNGKDYAKHRFLQLIDEKIEQKMKCLRNPTAKRELTSVGYAVPWSYGVSEYATTDIDELHSECLAMVASSRYKRGTLPKSVEDFCLHELYGDNIPAETETTN